MKAEDLWTQGISALPKELTNIFSKRPEFVYDQDHTSGTLKVATNTSDIELNFITATKISHAMIPLLKQLAISKSENNSKKTIILTTQIYPKIAQALTESGLFFLDTFGNINIITGNIALMRIASSPKEKKEATKQNRLFAESGIKLIFGILQDDDLINKTYREIAMQTLISPASVTILIRELTGAGFLHIGKDGKKVINDKQKLLDRWAIAYNEELKPKLFLGSYDSRAKNITTTFRQFAPETFGALWGGEAAAAIYTNYLKPAVLTLYATSQERKWMSALKLLPAKSNEAKIEVYRAFWSEQNSYYLHAPQLAHQILVYADLITSNDSRNIETANKLLNEHIHFKTR